MFDQITLRRCYGIFLGIGLLLICSELQAAVVAHYSFDTDFTDSSGNGYHGTAFDGNSDSDTAGATITNTAGEFVFGGGAASFTAERDWIDIPLQAFADGEAYSVSFWARDLAHGTSALGGMVIGQPGNSSSFIWIDSAAGGLRWRSLSDAANHQADFSFGNDGAWHHYVVIAGDFADADSVVDEIRLYRDNVLIGTDDGNVTTFNFDAIGEAFHTNNDLDFEGQIDEVWIFDEAIDEDMINRLYSNNLVPEQDTYQLLGFGLLSLGLLWWRRREKMLN